MKKKICLLLFSLAAIILEALPISGVIIFAPSPTLRDRQTRSYFDILLFGYGNFGPLITAVLSCLLLVLAVIYCVKGSPRVASAIRIISIVAFVSSLLPLMLGVECYSVIGAVISALIVAETVTAWLVCKAQNQCQS